MKNKASYYSYRKIWTGLIALLLVVVGVSIGYFFSNKNQTPTTGSSPQPLQTVDTKEQASSGAPKKEIWTCSMHPQIRLQAPGKCPICYMDLIPLESSSDDLSEGSAAKLTMSETARILAEVETTTVRRDKAKVLVRMLGMVAEDETRVAALTSRVDGRLDKIYVNFTGVQVAKGDPMVMIWSPTLIKNQVELFETLRTSAPDESVVKGAEEKLIQAGLTREQVDEIKEKKKPILYITLRAPISGTVTKKMAVLGQFVREGTEMYIVNDLSQVWIKLDAYETDIPWIRYGQDVTFTAASIPGKRFTGKVLFIDPLLDTKTRTVKVRLEASNPENQLKPGMFVIAELESEIGKTGKVIKSEWVGKYICPVHPRDQASDTPGTCPDSGLEMRPASSYGYAEGDDAGLPLVIPATAPLITGKRTVVYVEKPNVEFPTYELREVVLGPRAGHQYVVYDGLREGDRVVTKGAFKIDSAMQILAKPSMMHQGAAQGSYVGQGKSEEFVKHIKAPPAFLASLTPLIKQYLVLKQAFVDENKEFIRTSALPFVQLLDGVSSADMDNAALSIWKTLSVELKQHLNNIISSQNIQEARSEFDPLSETFVRLLMTFRHSMNQTLFVYYCSDAFGGAGAYWIEDSDKPRNPYAVGQGQKGEQMGDCGELIEHIAPDTLPFVPLTGNNSSNSESQKQRSRDTVTQHD
mgnify:CR=1 FL=1